MILDDITSFWWETITGPQMLVGQIVANLSDGKNVILQINHDFPWREHLRDFVAHHLEQVHLYSLSWSGGKTQAQVVPALLGQVHRNGSFSCPMDYKAQLEYLYNERIFENSVVWIVPECCERLSELLRFLSDYRGNSLEQHGAFVLESAEEEGRPLNSRSAVLRCSDYIRSSDLLLYASILADGVQGKPELRGYMASVVTNLAGQDAELIYELLQRVDFEREDPAEALARMWEAGSLPCPNQRPDKRELQMRVWRAQLQSAFGLIEMERLHIVDKYKTIIKEALSTEYWEPKRDKIGFIRQHGDELESAADVELGTLVRMMSLRRNDYRTQPLLIFPDYEMQNRIIFLTECRNNLAHHRVCTPGQMHDLLNFTSAS